MADRYCEDDARLEAFRAAVLSKNRVKIVVTWKRLVRWRRRMQRMPWSGRVAP
jgi:hypothetical protein